MNLDHHDPLPDILSSLRFLTLDGKISLFCPPWQVHKIYNASRFFIAFFIFSLFFSFTFSLCLSPWFAAAYNYPPPLYFPYSEPAPRVIFPRVKLFGSPSPHSIDFCVRITSARFPICTGWFIYIVFF